MRLNNFNNIPLEENYHRFFTGQGSQAPEDENQLAPPSLVYNVPGVQAREALYRYAEKAKILLKQEHKNQLEKLHELFGMQNVANGTGDAGIEKLKLVVGAVWFEFHAIELLLDSNLPQFNFENPANAELNMAIQVLANLAEKGTDLNAVQKYLHDNRQIFIATIQQIFAEEEFIPPQQQP